MIFLSGGTGGPKLLRGVKRVLSKFTVVANTAEDLWISGNLVCPDLDSVIYALSDLIDDGRWWGIKNDSFSTHEWMKRLGYKEKLAIGDMDRGIHIIRSELIRRGMRLTQATAEICRILKIRAKVLPMSDDEVRTMIKTPRGWMHFQDFWVTHRGRPKVIGIKFEGIKKARPPPELLEAIDEENSIVICPSNPITSIGPILGVIGRYIEDKFVIAVSPMIGGRVFSGPAAKLMRARGIAPSTRGVYDCYKRFLDLMIVDESEPEDLPVRTVRAKILMSDLESSENLAKLVCRLADFRS